MNQIPLPQPDSHSSSTAEPKVPFVAYLALLVVGTLLYFPSLKAPFYLDDMGWIKDQAKSQTLWPPMDWRRPVGVYTFQLGYALHGESAAKYRQFNIALHIANACLLMALIFRTLHLPSLASRYASRATLLAFVCALFWLIHPLQTNAVTYIIQRLESLMAFFFLLVLYATLRGASAPSPQQTRNWQLLAFAAFCFGVWTKEVMVACPPVLMLYYRLFLASSWKATFSQLRWLLLAMLLPLAFLGWSLRGTVLNQDDYYKAGFGYQAVTKWEYLRTQASIICHYLQLSVWPRTLVLDYGWKVEHNPWNIYPPGLLLVALLSLGCWGVWKGSRWALFILAFFLILAPTSSIMPIADLAFEHRMYLPLACVVVGLVQLADHALSTLFPSASTHRLATGLLIFLVAISLSCRTLLRNADYVDEVRFMEKNVQAAPLSGRAHINYAESLYSYYNRRLNSGELTEEKVAWLAQTIEREFEAGLELAPTDASAYAWYADWKAGQRNYAEAVKLYDKSLELNSQQGKVWYCQAMVLAETNQLSRALIAAKNAAKFEPMSEQQRAAADAGPERQRHAAQHDWPAVRAG